VGAFVLTAVCTRTGNRPETWSRTGRHNVLCRTSTLPIQRKQVLVVAGNVEAKVKVSLTGQTRSCERRTECVPGPNTFRFKSNTGDGGGRIVGIAREREVVGAKPAEICHPGGDDPSIGLDCHGRCRRTLKIVAGEICGDDASTAERQVELAVHI